MCVLVKLCENDGEQIYDMLQNIDTNDHGFHNSVKGMPYEEFLLWLKENAGYSNGVGLENWMVPQTTFWLYDNDRPVGCGRIRHFLNENLKKDGGHIGYAISYPNRGKGYGNKILKLLVEECRAMGIHEVHIGANKNNVRSNTIILHNGGTLCRNTELKNYYIINNAEITRQQSALEGLDCVTRFKLKKPT